MDSADIAGRAPEESLTHLQREQHRQDIEKTMRQLSTSKLMVIRAWLADVVENQKTCHMELARLRGSMVNEEIGRRGSSGVLSGLGGLLYATDAKWSVEKLARFPDVKPPAL